MNDAKIKKRLESIEATATLLIKEAAQLREDLKLTPARVTPKASLKQAMELTVAKRNAYLQQKSLNKKKTA